MFGGSDTDTLSKASGNTFERNLIASIEEAARGVDPTEAERAKYVLSALSNPALVAHSTLGGNLVDRAGMQFDFERGVAQRKAERSAYETGDVANMNPRLVEGWKQDNPETGEATGKGNRDNRFMRRMAMGTVERNPNPFMRGLGTSVPTQLSGLAAERPSGAQMAYQQALEQWQFSRAKAQAGGGMVSQVEFPQFDQWAQANGWSPGPVKPGGQGGIYNGGGGGMGGETADMARMREKMRGNPYYTDPQYTSDRGPGAWGRPGSPDGPADSPGQRGNDSFPPPPPARQAEMIGPPQRGNDQLPPLARGSRLDPTTLKRPNPFLRGGARASLNPFR